MNGELLNPEVLNKLVDAIAAVQPERLLLPTDAKARKTYPIVTGCLDYFPSALLEVAHVSHIGNLQHNGPDAPLHWARGKSMDQEDTSVRHLMERTERTGELTKDIDGVYHMAKACWRMLAIFQLALEREGAPLARGARLPEADPTGR